MVQFVVSRLCPRAACSHVRGVAWDRAAAAAGVGHMLPGAREMRLGAALALGCKAVMS